ncbi:VPLPA-CTERM sorting domain-containing protein [Paracoccus shandongensis]|uniref:VPLPA-CTERM sorting domain-containing protein n=1 Tax=Paracoccus shandongensis TaxID=2816048 RepID=UPI001A900FC3|nr:VPLPA-CTERM sorting domain-containing protein [Paracoccus shandongensis]
MKTTLHAAALGLAALLAAGPAALAATVDSVTVPLLDFGGIIHDVAQAGHYTLDFSGEGLLGNPDYLGFAGYTFAPVADLDELLQVLGGGVNFSVFDGSSVDLGYLEAGADFAAGVLSAGNTTMILVRIDQPVPVPLPASLPLLAASLGAAGVVLRRRKQA